MKDLGNKVDGKKMFNWKYKVKRAFGDGILTLVGLSYIIPNVGTGLYANHQINARSTIQAKVREAKHIKSLYENTGVFGKYALGGAYFVAKNAEKKYSVKK